MLILCIGTKISLKLTLPTVRVARQDVVGGALERTRHARARISNVLVLYSHAHTLHMIPGKISHFLVSLVLACCMPFTAALASVMAEGDSPDDRGPAGSGKT